MSGRGEILVGDKPLSTLRVIDLKAELDRRGLSKSGSKKELVDRLKASLLLDKDREEAAVSASNDEEELPNIAVAAKLPDDNPFVREYLASQAELFHSQQVAKKLYREEQKRESEGSGASADERERSPLKSPSKVSDPGSGSPLRHREDKAESSTRVDSSGREKSPEKRSTRGRPPGSKSKEHLEEPVEDSPKEESPPTKNPSKSKSTKPPEADSDSTDVEKSKENPAATKEEKAHSPTRSSRRGRKGSGYSDTAEAEPNLPPSSSKSGTTESGSTDNTEVTSTRETRSKSPTEKRSTRSRAYQAPSKPEVSDVDEPGSGILKVAKASESTTKEDSGTQSQSEPTEAPGEQTREREPVTSNSSAAEVKSTPNTEAEDKPVATNLAETKVVEKNGDSADSESTNRKSDCHIEDEGEKRPPMLSKSPEKEESVLPPPTAETKTDEKEKQEDEKPQSPVKRSPRKSRFHEAPEVDPAPVSAENNVQSESMKTAPTETQIVAETKDDVERDKNAEEKSNTKAKIKSSKVTEILFEDAKKTELVSVPSEKLNEDEPPKTLQSLRVPEATPPRKIRSHSPITAPTPELPKKPRLIERRETEPVVKRTTSVEKENILDEVLDYGDEDEEMTEVQEVGSTVKRSTVVSTKPRAVKATESPLASREAYDVGPVVFERRILKLKPNRHTQRRKEKLLEDRKAREKEEERSKVDDFIISSEVFEEWFPDMVLLTDEEIFALEEANAASGEGDAADDKIQIIRTISNLDVIEGEEMEEVGEESEQEEEEHQAPEMDLTIQRKISLISMDEEMSKHEQTPPRRAPTQLILVTNLVRPFTVPQLKELLQRTGNVIDLWVDKIKSRCVAKYDTEDEAIETRTALHGVKWPASNPKSLSVDFTTEERAEDLRKKDSGYIEEKPTVSHQVREWDVGKKSPPREARKRSHSRERDRDTRGEERARKRSRRSRSHSGHRRRSQSRTSHSDRKDRNGDVKKSESSGKTLDELFRKTLCVPCIYWLPLNPQQILEKEELRRKRMEERERRIAEIQQQQQSQRSQQR